MQSVPPMQQSFLTPESPSRKRSLATTSDDEETITDNEQDDDHDKYDDMPVLETLSGVKVASDAMVIDVTNDVSSTRVNKKASLESPLKLRAASFATRVTTVSAKPSVPVGSSTITPVTTATSKRVNEKMKKRMSKIVLNEDGSLKPFSEIGVSTRTCVVLTNCTVDLDRLFTYAPLIDYQPPVKRRGRRSKYDVEPPVPRLPFGSVLNIQMEDKKRGLFLSNGGVATAPTAPATPASPSTPSEPSTPRIVTSAPTGETKKSFFLHCAVMDIHIDDYGDQNDEIKFKNVKVYRNGKLHITGCKNDKQYLDTVKAVFQLYDAIETYIGEPVIACQDPTYRAVFNTVMQNMDFYIGFNIFRIKLDEFINQHTDYRSIFEGSSTTGVNIKIPIMEQDQKLMSFEYDKATQICRNGWVNYADFKHFFPRKSKKEKEHTFLVFASGTVIFTSSGPEMEHVFNKLIGLLVKNRHFFEEKQR